MVWMGVGRKIQDRIVDTTLLEGQTQLWETNPMPFDLHLFLELRHFQFVKDVFRPVAARSWSGPGPAPA